MAKRFLIVFTALLAVALVAACNPVTTTGTQEEAGPDSMMGGCAAHRPARRHHVAGSAQDIQRG